MLVKATKSRSGFTLIELLVVIAIIAILAAILFPVFAKARDKAQGTACLSNEKNIGMGLMMYSQDWDNTFPQCYYYKDGNSGTNGYEHWSGLISQYVKNDKVWVCPSSANNGWAPANYSTATDNQGKGVPGGQVPLNNSDIDNQAGRISYAANEVIMPRLKYAKNAASPDAGPMWQNLQVVKANIIDDPSNTIMIGEMTDVVARIYASSDGAATAVKSHRPISALMGSATGGEYNQEKGPWSQAGNIVYGVNKQIADAGCAAALAAGKADGQPHITYCKYDAHNEGANYIYCDGHAKYQKLEQTLGSNWQWGKKVYSVVSQPTVQPQ